MSERSPKTGIDIFSLPRWLAVTASGAVLTACVTVPGLEADALVYNDDGTTTQNFYVNNGQTLHHTVTTACIQGSTTFEGTTTTDYASGFVPEGQSDPTVEHFNSNDLCDEGKIVPNEQGIPQSALDN